MRVILAMVTICSLCLACAGAKKNSLQQETITTDHDTSRYAVIPYDTAIKTQLLEGKGRAALSADEISEIDGLIKKAVNEHNMVVRGYMHIDSLEKYKFQLVAYTNRKGEKEVWVNAFCSKEAGWRTTIISADDGGNCYFNFKINLTLKTSTQVMVNGQG